MGQTVPGSRLQRVAGQWSWNDQHKAVEEKSDWWYGRLAGRAGGGDPQESRLALQVGGDKRLN